MIRVNIFCQACNTRLNGRREHGRSMVDIYVVPCEKCAAKHSVKSDSYPHAKNCARVASDEVPPRQSLTPPTREKEIM